MILKRSRVGCPRPTGHRRAGPALIDTFPRHLGGGERPAHLIRCRRNSARRGAGLRRLGLQGEVSDHQGSVRRDDRIGVGRIAAVQCYRIVAPAVADETVISWPAGCVPAGGVNTGAATAMVYRPVLTALVVKSR